MPLIGKALLMTALSVAASGIDEAGSAVEEDAITVNAIAAIDSYEREQVCKSFSTYIYERKDRCGREEERVAGQIKAVILQKRS